MHPKNPGSTGNTTWAAWIAVRIKGAIHPNPAIYCCRVSKELNFPSRYALNKETIRIKHTISEMEDIHFLNLLTCVSIILHHFRDFMVIVFSFRNIIFLIFLMLDVRFLNYILFLIGRSFWYMLGKSTFFLMLISMLIYTLSHIWRKSEQFCKRKSNIFLPNIVFQ